MEIKELSYWKKQGYKIRIKIFKIIKMKMMIAIVNKHIKRMLIKHQVEYTIDKKEKEKIEMLQETSQIITKRIIKLKTFSQKK